MTIAELKEKNITELSRIAQIGLGSVQLFCSKTKVLVLHDAKHEFKKTIISPVVSHMQLSTEKRIVRGENTRALRLLCPHLY